MLNFTTSSVVDETPPDVLNLDAEVLEDGRVTIAWYTSESATESISLNGEVIHSDAYATKKNHAFTTVVLADGTYELLVVSMDASGNSNSSTLSFNVDLGGDGETQPTLENNDDENEATDDAAGVSGDTLQLLALVVVALVLLAFLRVRGLGPSEDDPWD